MPPSFYCKPRWIKAGGRSTGHSLAPSTQIQFMNNQSKKCLSEQHCAPLAGFLLPPAGWRDAAVEWKGVAAQAKKKPVVMTGFFG